jgi:glycosyltransferase involved in cell wall biosynthesis
MPPMTKEFIVQQDPSHVSVCICTYKRPELLSDLLSALQQQQTDGLFEFSILVIDNDYRHSAEPVVLSVAKKSSLDIRYYVEQTQNISLARNKAVQNAKGDFIAFIDDDEIPEINWLCSLYRALHHFGADAVLGPVLPFYKAPPPKWVVKGKFYERARYKTGFKIDWMQGRTGNLLVKKEMFRATGELFDPKFGAGGEDQDFTRRMIGRGYAFVWCNEARAYEIVPPVRWNRIFMLRRALLRGKMSLGYPTSRFVMLAKALLAIPIYTMALPLLFALGQHLFMLYLVKIFDHSGRLLAMMNLEVIKPKYVTQ